MDEKDWYNLKMQNHWNSKEEVDLKKAILDLHERLIHQEHIVSQESIRNYAKIVERLERLEKTMQHHATHIMELERLFKSLGKQDDKNESLGNTREKPLDSLKRPVQRDNKKKVVNNGKQ